MWLSKMKLAMYLGEWLQGLVGWVGPGLAVEVVPRVVGGVPENP